MDGTSRLRLVDGTTLKHGLRTACFAERTVVAAGGAVPLPRELPLWQAALLGCGVVTGMGAVRNVGRRPARRLGRGARLRGRRAPGRRRRRGSRAPTRSSPSTASRRSSSWRVAQGATHVVDASRGRRARQHDPPAHRRRRRLRVRGDRPRRRRCGWRGARSGRAAPPSSSALRREGVEASVPAIEFLSDKSLRGTYYGSGDPAAELPGLACARAVRASSTSPASSPTSTARRRRGGVRPAPPRRGRAYHPRDRPRDRGRADTSPTEASDDHHLRRPAERRRRRRRPRHPLPGVHRRRVRRRGLGRDLRLRQPDRGRGRRAGRRVRLGRRRPRGRRARAPHSSRAPGRGSRRRSASACSRSSPG